MKKTFFTIIFGAFFALAAFAQEQAVYAQYQLFPILVNPGYTGFEGKSQFIGNARSTWTGFPGKPSTYTVMYSAPLGDKLALGGGIFNEKAGEVNTLRLQLNYAFRFRIQKAQIGLGLSTEFLNKNLNRDLLDPSALIDGNDDILQQNAEGSKLFDATFGAHVLYDNRFFVSVSLPNAIRARLDEVPTDQPTETTNLFEHYIMNLGYIVNVGDQNVKLIPSLTLRNVRDVPYQVDLNLQGRFLDEKLIAGLTYRPNTNGSMAFMIGTKYHNLQLVYCYDVSFSNFQQYNGGSHEIGLAFGIDRKKTAMPGTPDSQVPTAPIK